MFVLSGAEDLVPVADDARGRVALPTAHRGVVRPHRARARRHGRLLGGPQPGRAADPLRHAATDRCRPGLARPGRHRRSSVGRARPGVRLADHRDHRPVRQPGPLHLRRAITARSRGTPGTSRSSAASTTPTTATGPIRRSWFGWTSTTSSGRTRSPTTGPGSRSAPRCAAARSGSSTHAADGVARAVREYRFGYEQAPFNGASLLTRVDVVGIDDQIRHAATRAAAAADVRLHRVRAATAPVRPGHRRRACRPARSATRRWRWSTCAAAGCPTSSSSAPPRRYLAQPSAAGASSCPARCRRRRRSASANRACSSSTPTATAAPTCWSSRRPRPATSR